MKQILSRLVQCVTDVVLYLKESQNLCWEEWKEITV